MLLACASHSLQYLVLAEQCFKIFVAVALHAVICTQWAVICIVALNACMVDWLLHPLIRLLFLIATLLSKLPFACVVLCLHSLLMHKIECRLQNVKSQTMSIMWHEKILNVFSYQLLISYDLNLVCKLSPIPNPLQLEANYKYVQCVSQLHLWCITMSTKKAKQFINTVSYPSNILIILKHTSGSGKSKYNDPFFIIWLLEPSYTSDP